MSTPTETSTSAAPDRNIPERAFEDRAFEAAWADWHAAHERHRADPHGFLAVTHLHWLDAAPARLDGAPGTWSAENDVVRLVLGPGERVLRDGQELNPDGTGATVVLGPIAEREGLNLRVEDAGAGHTVIEVAKRGGRVHCAAAAPAEPAARRVPRHARLRTHAPICRPPDTIRAVRGAAAHDGGRGRRRHPARLRGPGRDPLPAGRPGPGADRVQRPRTRAHSPCFSRTRPRAGPRTRPTARSPLPRPAPDGTVTLDFNRAVNLPCAYTDLATCPLPPAENRLPVAIEAGEQIPYERQDAS